ncbi:MAG: pyrroline-5-carboxylate reductase, partial [Bacteroidota bacterium]
MSNNKIAIIGGGNLGASIAEGLIQSGFVKANQITLTKRNLQTIQHLADKGVTVTSNNASAVKEAQYVILAVKPFQIKDILTEIKSSLLAGQHTIISVATGVWIKDVEEILNSSFA